MSVNESYVQTNIQNTDSLWVEQTNVYVYLDGFAVFTIMLIFWSTAVITVLKKMRSSICPRKHSVTIEQMSTQVSEQTVNIPYQNRVVTSQLVGCDPYILRNYSPKTSDAYCSLLTSSMIYPSRWERDPFCLPSISQKDLVYDNASGASVFRTVARGEEAACCRVILTPSCSQIWCYVPLLLCMSHMWVLFWCF